MKWRKLGRIYAPSGEQWWARSHTHVPTVTIIDDTIIRVFFTGLDENNYGRIGYVDLDIDDPMTVIHIADEPVLDLGEPGTFDDSGVVPSHVISLEGETYLYYIGFQRAERVPYMLFSGLAKAGMNQTDFQKVARVPILDRTHEEPFSRSALFLLSEEDRLHAWYWSCIKWTVTDEAVHYNNVIKYATSDDGVHWRSHEHHCIEPDFETEYAVGRPCVIRDGSLYRMWYSTRAHNAPYVIGYAESGDGIHWQRKDDEVGITMSDDGWDSEMICYPYVLDIRGQRYMFYNGNRHGKTGFGCAILEQD